MTRPSLGPWLWSPGIDLGVFGGSALIALALVGLGRLTGLSAQRESPTWVWLAVVLAVDVAHVYSTLFRTYFDAEELRGRALRYLGVPIAAYLLGVALHLAGSGYFWTVVAYVAVFHFVRQQVGWVAVYRARARGGQLDRVLDEAAVYAATLYPLAYWHAHLETTRFVWMREGDFVAVSAYARLLEPFLFWVWLGAIAAFGVRQLTLLVAGRLELGKTVVVVTTVVTWYVGIVGSNSDFDFTVTNVLVHGVPYGALLWFYAQERSRDAPTALGSRILRGGLAAFAGALIGIAFLEEVAWEHLVWHDRPWLFGALDLELGAPALALVVPLLAVPQLTHYALDGLIWRRADTRRLRAQRAALGFST